MTEFKSTSNLEARTKKEYGGTYVFASVSTKVEIESCHLMSIIIDNWDSIDAEARHRFARKIAALDSRDAMRMIEPKPENDEEGFRWR
jgi:hypothetical protein